MSNVRPLASSGRTDTPNGWCAIEAPSGSTDHGSHKALARFVTSPGVHVSVLSLGRLAENAQASSLAARPSGRSKRAAVSRSVELKMQANAGTLAERFVVFQRLHAAGRRSTLPAMNNIASHSPNGRVTTFASGHQRSNPSIEGTCNIWLRQLSPAPHVKR